MARIPLGPKIRSRRKDQGLTQAALASAIGISASYMNLKQPKKAKNKVMAFTYNIMSQMIGFLPLKSLNKIQILIQVTNLLF